MLIKEAARPHRSTQKRKALNTKQLNYLQTTTVAFHTKGTKNDTIPIEIPLMGEGLYENQSIFYLPKNFSIIKLDNLMILHFMSQLN